MQKPSNTNRVFMAAALTAAALLLSSATADAQAPSTAYWGRYQRYEAFSPDALAMAGEWDYHSSSWVASQGGGMGSFIFTYDTFYYSGRWYALVLYSYASGQFEDYHFLLTP